MFSKNSRRILSVLIVFVLLFSIAGVSATWIYAGGSVNSLSFDLAIDAFPWDGSDILPDDIEGQHHKLLIDSIIYGTSTDSNGNVSEIGLNNPDSELSKQIANRTNINRDTFGSMDIRDSSQMSNIFDLDTSELAFMIHSPKNQPDVKYIYTTGTKLGEASNLFNPKPHNYPNGERIYPVYQTKLIGTLNSDGDYVWEPEKTIVGSASPAFYQNDWFGSGVIRNPAWDVNTFVPFYQEDCADGVTAIAMGESADYPIYIPLGTSVNEKIGSETSIAYFKYTASTNGIINVTRGADSDALTISVYSNKQLTNLVTSSSEESFKFTASRNTSYYFTATGCTTINFSLS